MSALGDLLPGTVFAVVVGAAIAYVLSYIVSRLNALRRVRIQVGGLEIAFESLEESEKALRELVERRRAQPRVFLSYASGDKEFVESLTRDLREKGVQVVFDEELLKPGDRISEEIERALGDSEWFLYVLSPEMLQSRWGEYELRAALGREEQMGRPFVIPVVHERVEMPESLADRVHVDFSGDYDEALVRLLSGVKRGSAAKQSGEE